MGAQQGKPLAVVNCPVNPDLTTEDVHRDLLQSFPAQLPVESLDPQLRALVGELLYLAQQALLVGELLFHTVEHLAMYLGAFAEIGDADSEPMALLLENAITGGGQLDYFAPLDAARTCHST